MENVQKIKAYVYLKIAINRMESKAKQGDKLDDCDNMLRLG